MSDPEVAFYIGLFGSLHCLGMCGPLAFAIPLSSSSKYLILLDKFTYNLGRIVSYSVLGYVIGLIGKQLWLYGLQQGVSILSGLLVICAALSRLFKWQLQSKYASHLFKPVSRLLHYALQHRAGHFMTGMVNGLLPCGFVYIALVGAVNNSSAVSAAQYMFWFGAGTLPLMFIAMVSTSFIRPARRVKINRIVPYFMLFLGIWFVLRGLNLNIPYLSPPVNTTGNSVCR